MIRMQDISVIIRDITQEKPIVESFPADPRPNGAGSVTVSVVGLQRNPIAYRRRHLDSVAHVSKKSRRIIEIDDHDWLFWLSYGLAG